MQSTYIRIKYFSKLLSESLLPNSAVVDGKIFYHLSKKQNGKITVERDGFGPGNISLALYKDRLLRRELK